MDGLLVAVFFLCFIGNIGLFEFLSSMFLFRKKGWQAVLLSKGFNL